MKESSNDFPSFQSKLNDNERIFQILEKIKTNESFFEGVNELNVLLRKDPCILFIFLFK